MKHRIIFAVALCLLGTACALAGSEPAQGPASAPASQPAASAANPAAPVQLTADVPTSVTSPLEKDFIRAADEVWVEHPYHVQFRRDMTQGLKPGESPFKASTKTPAYYRKLSTQDLAAECFSTGHFMFEMSSFNTIREGFIRLTAWHPGFAELFSREDRWRGILSQYDAQAKLIDRRSDLKTIILASGNFNALADLYRMPEFARQVRGREADFLAANLRAIDRYRQYVREFDPGNEQRSLGFAREPMTLTWVAVILAKRLEPEAGRAIEVELEATHDRLPSRQAMLVRLDLASRLLTPLSARHPPGVAATQPARR